MVSDSIPPWAMPLTPDTYDRAPGLSAAERAALAILGAQDRRTVAGDRTTWQALTRLSAPLEDVHTLSGKYPGALQASRRVLFAEMRRRDSAFWAWTAAEWLETCGSSAQAYHARYPTLSLGRGRHHLLTLVYLLAGVRDLRPFGLSQSCVPVARIIFGPERLEAAMERVGGVLYGPEGLGYEKQHHHWSVRRALCQVLLLNQSPHLEAISLPLLETLAAEETGARRLRPESWGSAQRAPARPEGRRRPAGRADWGCREGRGRHSPACP